MANGTLKTEKQGGDYDVERKQNNNDKVTIGPRHQQQVLFYDNRDLYSSGKNNITREKNMCSFINRPLVKCVLLQLIRLSLGMPQAKQKAI